VRGKKNSSGCPRRRLSRVGGTGDRSAPLTTDELADEAEHEHTGTSKKQRRREERERTERKQTHALLMGPVPAASRALGALLADSQAEGRGCMLV
jgi:hypothetical protein